jgi:hypothetical protein
MKPTIPVQQVKKAPAPVVVAQKPTVTQTISPSVPHHPKPSLSDTEWEFYEGMEAHEMDINVAKFILFKVKSCKERGVEWKLTFQAVKNLMKAKKCYYTGQKLTQPVKGVAGFIKRETDITLDRIDCKKGYVKGNVVACSTWANQLKSEAENKTVFGVDDAAKVFVRASKRLKKQDGV